MVTTPRRWTKNKLEGEQKKSIVALIVEREFEFFRLDILLMRKNINHYENKICKIKK